MFAVALLLHYCYTTVTLPVAARGLVARSPCLGLRGGGEEGAWARREPLPRACARQDILIERHDGSLERPFAKAHGNTQPAGSVQDAALRLKKLMPHLALIEYIEDNAKMEVEEIKAARDEADPLLARREKFPSMIMCTHMHVQTACTYFVCANALQAKETQGARSSCYGRSKSLQDGT